MPGYCIGNGTFIQAITLGGSFSVSMFVNQLPMTDGTPDELPAFQTDLTYSIGSIELFDLNGHELTGLKYATASGVRYPIEGATFVPEPSSLFLLLAVGLALLAQKRISLRHLRR